MELCFPIKDKTPVIAIILICPCRKRECQYSNQKSASIKSASIKPASLRRYYPVQVMRVSIWPLSGSICTLSECSPSDLFIFVKDILLRRICQLLIGYEQGNMYSKGKNPFIISTVSMPLNLWYIK